MAEWDRDDLHAKIRYEIGRPSTDEDNSAAELDYRLSVAQSHWIRTFAAVIPAAVRSDWAAMTQSSNFYEVPDSLTSAESYREVCAVDVRDGATGMILEKDQYILEQKPGSTTNVRPRIRLPYNRSFSFTPYCRVVAMPPPITASVDPTLTPPTARILLVFHACASWAAKGERHNPAPYINKMQAAWLGNPDLPGDIGLLGQLRALYADGELELGEYSGGNRWYRSVDLG